MKSFGTEVRESKSNGGEDLNKRAGWLEGRPRVWWMNARNPRLSMIPKLAIIITGKIVEYEY